MSSEVDISNLALSHLGDQAQVTAIDPPDGSMQATLCSRFYPIARDLVLEMFPWTFATKRAVVAELATNPAPLDWSYAYSLPSTCIRPLSALWPGTPERYFGDASDAGSHAYIVEAGSDGTPVLYTNVQAATLRYIDLIRDTTKFSPGFVVCVSRLLASYLAGPILKGITGMKVAQAELQIFNVEFAKAAAANANVGKRNAFESRVPSHIAARAGFTLQR